MSRLASIIKNKITTPVRVLIYGIEGVGKSSFGAKAPKPIFICPEGGVDELDNAQEMPNVKTWDDVVASVRELIAGDHEFQTLVLDSADWLEKLAHGKIIGQSTKSIVTVNGGYGTGYRESETLHRELIALLSELREKRHMNVIICAHYHVKEVKDPEAMADYDAFEIKCHEFVSALWREWVDCVFFARFKTLVKVGDDDNGKTRAMGTGERVVYTEKRPSFQAKNRYGLPAEMTFHENFYNEFALLSGKANPEAISKTIIALTTKIKDEVLRKKVEAFTEAAKGDAKKLAGILKRVNTILAE